MTPFRASRPADPQPVGIQPDVRWRGGGAPLVPLAIAGTAGIALAPVLPVWPAWLLLAAAGLLGLGVALAGVGRARPAAVLLLAAAAALGAVRASPLPAPAAHVVHLVAAAERSGERGLFLAVEGLVAEEPVRARTGRLRLLLDLETAEIAGARRPATGRVLLTVRGEAPSIGHGQRVAATVTLSRPVGFRNPGGFDYPASLRRRGIHVTGSGPGALVRSLGAEDPPWPVRARRWAVGRLEAALPEVSAALLAGLLLGERGHLPPDIDAAHRRAGVSHVLAVSGFNVALVTAGAWWALRLLGTPRRLGALLAAATLTAFALVAGLEPSVLRAAVMGLLVLAAVLLGRESQVLNAVGLAAVVLLAWRPQDLADPGFQLSFAATLGIVALAPALANGMVSRGCPRGLSLAVAVSLAAQAAVAPVTAAHFHQVSLVGLVANLAVVPLAAVATTLGLAGLVASVASEMAGDLLLHATWPALLAMRAAVRGAAAMPGALAHPPAPPWHAFAAWYAGLALLGWPPAARWRGLAGGILLVASALGTLWPWLRPADARLRVTFLDVGQGDAVLVEVPRGPRLLIDGGPAGPHRLDAGERVVAPFLWDRGVTRIDAVALTHSDPDHAGGLATVLRHFPVGALWENGVWDTGGEEARRAAERAGVPRWVVGAGNRIQLGEAEIRVLHPGPEPPRGENDRSLVLRLEWRGLALLLTGDIEARGEAALLARGLPLDAHVLKVAHHGSRRSTGEAFLGAVRPGLAVIPVGARNAFGHPAPETLARLDAAGVRVYRTDRDGAIILESDGESLWVTRWAARRTDRFRLAERREDTTAPGGVPGGRGGTRGNGRGD